MWSTLYVRERPLEASLSQPFFSIQLSISVFKVLQHLARHAEKGASWSNDFYFYLYLKVKTAQWYLTNWTFTAYMLVLILKVKYCICT